MGEGSETQKAPGHVYCEGHADEVSDGTENLLGNWSRSHPCFLVAEGLASSCSCPDACWKTGLPSDQPMYRTEEIAKPQSTQVAAWLLGMAYDQMREQRDRLKMKLDKKKAEQQHSQKRSHRDLRRKGFSEQVQAKKIKTDKQRLRVLNPGNKKNSLRGPQERAPEVPGNSNLLQRDPPPRLRP